MQLGYNQEFLHPVGNRHLQLLLCCQTPSKVYRVARCRLPINYFFLRIKAGGEKISYMNQ